MTPRLEYALSAGLLAFALAPATVFLVTFRLLDDAMVWQLSAAAGLAALLSAGWVSGWQWLLDADRRARRVFGLAFCTVLLALGLFFPLCMAMLGVGMAAHLDVLELAEVVAVLLAFAAGLGGLPALLLTSPLAWRFLWRRDRRVAA